MGQKVHPVGFRLGYTQDWRSRWYAKRDYADLLHEDIALRDKISRRFHHAGVSRVEIERAANKLKVDIHTARPGIVIGRNGAEVDRLKKDIEGQRRAVETAMRFGAEGIKVRCGGRLGGLEISRAEWYLQGNLPLHTLRADIDYGFAESATTYGQIGVKVWVYRGQIYDVAGREAKGQ